jgi:pimeloyl-ACP methyl ester carboxylesterase
VIVASSTRRTSARSPSDSPEIPDAELMVMEGVTHLPALEGPEEIARLVREFLAR